MFASIGWVLGQLVDPQNAPFSLDQIRANLAIASVLLLVPMLSGLFFILVMEAARQVQSLARYRFLLACALEPDPPGWRWELFKLTKEGSIRSWTNPSNIFLGFFALTASVGVFVFVNPAVGNPVVNRLRWLSAIYTTALAAAVGWAGWTRRHENDEFGEAALAAGHGFVASVRDGEGVAKIWKNSSDLPMFTPDVTVACDLFGAPSSRHVFRAGAHAGATARAEHPRPVTKLQSFSEHFYGSDLSGDHHALLISHLPPQV